MLKRPLDELFFAMHRGKLDFDEFVECVPSKMHEKIFMLNGREIVKPNTTLKAYLSFLNRILFERLPINKEAVFSYRKGVNAVDAVRRHQGNKFFFQCDITNFFTSIDCDIVQEAIERGAGDIPVSDISDWMLKIINIVTYNGSLPAGYSTSPVISNTCLFDFDNEFSKFCEKKSMVFSRYADDIIVSSKHESFLLDVPFEIERSLCSNFDGKLRLNPEKSKFLRPGNRVKLLGIMILPNGRVTVDIKYKKDTEVGLHYYINAPEKLAEFMDEKIEDAISKLSGWLNYINTVDPEYLDKLKKKYGVTVVDRLIHNSSKAKA